MGESACCVREAILLSRIVYGFDPDVGPGADPEQLSDAFSEIGTLGSSVEAEHSRLVVHQKKETGVVESLFLHLVGEVGDNIAQFLDMYGEIAE